MTGHAAVSTTSPSNDRSVMVLPARAQDLDAVSRRDLAGTVLRSATGCWFFVTVIGQWLFTYYIVALYHGSILSGHLEESSRGYTPGDTAGNLAFAAHVVLAAVVAFGGLIQLIPQLRGRAIAVHRWNGRAFLVAATMAAGSGLYMKWARSASFLRYPQVVVNAVSSSLNAVLILVFVTWRGALRACATSTATAGGRFARSWW